MQFKGRCKGQIIHEPSIRVKGWSSIGDYKKDVTEFKIYLKILTIVNNGMHKWKNILY